MDVVTWVLVPKEMRKRPGASPTKSEELNPGWMTYGTATSAEADDAVDGCSMNGAVKSSNL